MRHRWIATPIALMLALGATVGPPAYAASQVVLARDSVLKVRLDNTLSSAQNQNGDRFTATVENQGSGYNLPDGSRVEGTVTEVQQANSDRPGSLDVDFTTLRLPDGETYRISGAPISLDSKSVQRTSDGRLMARSSSNSKNRTKFLAYGAGAGFVIGSLLGSNIKGALAGAAAGYLYGMLNKNKANGRDVVLNPGTEFGVRLDQSVALASLGGANYGRSFAAGYGQNQNTYNRGSYNRSGYGRNAAATSAYSARQAVLPAGSVLKVKLDGQLSSETSQRGDQFTATVVGEDSGSNLPAGTHVEGTVTEVQRASSDRPGSLDVDFNALRLSDGETYRISGAPISLDSKSVQRTSDGRLMARSSSSKNRTKFLAYGAGAGFVIGSLLGSNIKGALAGAAAGYLFGQYHKNKANGHDVVLKPGTEFGVRLDQRVALAARGAYGYR